MSSYELLHAPMVANGHVIAIVEKLEKYMEVGHLNETAERESIA